MLRRKFRVHDDVNSNARDVVWKVSSTSWTQFNKMKVNVKTQEVPLAVIGLRSVI